MPPEFKTLIAEGYVAHFGLQKNTERVRRLDRVDYFPVAGKPYAGPWASILVDGANHVDVEVGGTLYRCRAQVHVLMVDDEGVPDLVGDNAKVSVDIIFVSPEVDGATLKGIEARLADQYGPLGRELIERRADAFRAYVTEQAAADLVRHETLAEEHEAALRAHREGIALLQEFQARLAPAAKMGM